MNDLKRNEEFLNVELDDYENWVESEIEKGNFVPVENFEEWKKALEEAARRTLEKLEKKKIRITIELEKAEEKDRLLELLKEQFGGSLRIVGA
jgi:single-stranded DNA-specific DHH superfamily exonuclease